MELDLDTNQAKYRIKAYRPGKIEVNDTAYTRSLVISRDRLIDDWKPQKVSELTPEDLAIIRDWDPSILLIGTGPAQIFPEPGIYGDLVNQGIGVEIMETGAACRTYTALVSENRNVVAALML